MKPQSYVPREKILLNSKYIKTNQNQKFKVKFFSIFQILYPIEKQIYKLNFFIKQKIHNIFYALLLEQNITKKKWINELFLKPKSEFNIGNNKKYKIEVISNNTIYAKKVKKYLPSLYYLIF